MNMVGWWSVMESGDWSIWSKTWSRVISGIKLLQLWHVMKF